MAEAITTNRYRQHLARAMAGSESLQPIRFMAFGDGGHNPTTLQPIAPDPAQTALRHERLRKPLASITHEDSYSVTGMGAVDYSELIGVAISEAALIDASGALVGIKNFSPKIKEGDERYETSVKLRF